MTQFAHNRDNVLNDEERAASGRKCLDLLLEVDIHNMTSKEQEFLAGQMTRSDSVSYSPSERQLQWLRDMVSKYVT